MMKHILVISLLFASLSMVAQSPEAGRFEFYKKIAETAPGLTTIFEGSPDDFKGILESRTSDAENHRLEKVKGDLYAQYGMLFTTISEQRLDYYWRIEDAPRQAGKTKVTLFMALGNDNFMDQSAYASEFQAAGNFLTSIRQDINAELMRQVLAEMETAYEDEMKKLRDLTGESESQAKRKKKLEEELAELIEKQAETTEAIEKQNQIIQQLRSQVQGMRVQMQEGN